jgi:hypothetical protein
MDSRPLSGWIPSETPDGIRGNSGIQWIPSGILAIFVYQITKSKV